MPQSPELLQDRDHSSWIQSLAGQNPPCREALKNTQISQISLDGSPQQRNPWGNGGRKVLLDSLGFQDFQGHFPWEAQPTAP